MHRVRVRGKREREREMTRVGQPEERKTTCVGAVVVGGGDWGTYEYLLSTAGRALVWVFWHRSGEDNVEYYYVPHSHWFACCDVRD